MTTRTQHTATPPPHVDYADELRRITKGKRGAFSRVENEDFSAWFAAKVGVDVQFRVTPENAQSYLDDVQRLSPRRTWPGKAATIIVGLTIFILFALGAINEAWRLYGNINTTQPTVAPLPTAAVAQPADKTDQQRPNPAPAPVLEVAPIAPVVKEAQEVAKPAPVVAAPVVSESDKAHQAAPGTAERVQAVESTPEAQKGAQGRSGGVKEENVKGGRGKP